MNDPQTWTLLGVFSGLFLAVVGFSVRSAKDVKESLTAQMTAMEARLSSRMDVSDAHNAARFEALDTKIDHRYDALDAKIDQRCDDLERKFDQRCDDLERRLDEKSGVLDHKIDDRSQHLAELLAVRIGSVEHRLGAVEDDLKIVKAHLLRHPAA